MNTNCSHKYCDTQCLKTVENAWLDGDRSLYPSSFVECVNLPPDATPATYRCRATGVEWTGWRTVPPFVPEGCRQEHIAIGVTGHYLPDDAKRMSYNRQYNERVCPEKRMGGDKAMNDNDYLILIVMIWLIIIIAALI